MAVYWLVLFMAVPINLVKGLSPTTAIGGINPVGGDNPKRLDQPYWFDDENTSYAILRHSRVIPSSSWEDARAYCVKMGGDLLSINSQAENTLIANKIASYHTDIFWFGLKRNNRKWIWVDGNNADFTKWAWGEPNNYLNSEDCGEIYSRTGNWNDNNCQDRRSFICEGERGKMVLPTLPTIPTQVYATTNITCKRGWKAFGSSCYKFIKTSRSWSGAKEGCVNLGGHLLIIDDKEEQDYFYSELRSKAYSRFWIGLNKLGRDGLWKWTFTNAPPNYTNWNVGEPNGGRRERCTEMYGGMLSAFWNDEACYVTKQYICEKEGDKKGCPDDWYPYEDNCYQFNLLESQLKNWSDAQHACESIGDFSSLASIHSESEQAFLTAKVNLIAQSEVWIGLNDRQSENLYKWTDNTKFDYENWFANTSGNKPWKDCTLMMGMRSDGAWTKEMCSEKRRFICKRAIAIFDCDEPLGMENGLISDEQITAKNFKSLSEGPTMARLRNQNEWCPKIQGDYLQIDLGSNYKITKIAVQGLATSYCIKYGYNGKSFKKYGKLNSMCKGLRSVPSNQPHFLRELQPFVARYIRVTPTQGKKKCVRLEVYGCLSESTIDETHKDAIWSKIPSSDYQYQINNILLSWEEARSHCLEQNADLLSLSDSKVIQHMNTQLTRLSVYSWWIGMSNRDGTFLWTDGSPVNYINWHGLIIGNAKCAVVRRIDKRMQLMSCSNRYNFVCMRKDPSSLTNDLIADPNRQVIDKGVTGVWKSSASLFWPLSNVDDRKISGTVDGAVYGDVLVISGVKNKTESALLFTKSGMYIDVKLKETDCLILPDICPSKEFTLSFMASFDITAATWSKVFILDTLEKNEEESTGVSVYVDQKKLWFVVSYVHMFWKIDVPINGDSVWRHYVVVCDIKKITLYVNGESVNERSYRYNSRKIVISNKRKTSLYIGLTAKSKVTRGDLGLSMLAFWEGALSLTDIQGIYNTEFSWCPIGWKPFGMSCYQFNGYRSTWINTRARCQRYGGDLIVINTPVKQAMVTRRIRYESWIGLNEASSPTRTFPSRFDIWGSRGYRSYRRYRRFGGYWRRRSYSWRSPRRALTFIWASGSPNRFTNWQSHRVFYTGSKTCASVNGGGVIGAWRQKYCTSYLSSLCEKEKVESKRDVNDTDATGRFFTRICQFSTKVISCSSGTVIKIHSGFWGRKNRDVCRRISIIDCGLNTVSRVTHKLMAECEGLSECKLQASDDPKHFGNLCSGVYKYLEVIYSCVKEENYQTNPCEIGWIRSKHKDVGCYRLMESKKSWSEAEKTCEKYGAKLLSIRDRSEQVLATYLMENAWNTDVWIGLSDAKTPCKYTWSDGASVSWTNWAVGYPRGVWSGEHCVFMNLKGATQDMMYWRVGNCSQEKLFMCKKIIYKSPNTITSNTKDGGCSSGFTLFRGKCYKLFNDAATWSSAESFCKSWRWRYRGHLVSITDKEENDFVSTLANVSIWIGLEGRGIFRGHVWSDGTPVSYTNWDKGQPDSFNGQEACTQLNSDIRYWSDVNCYFKKPFVCKVDQGYGQTTTVSPTSQSPRCKKGWTLFNDRCYLIGPSVNDSAYTTWHEADTICKSMGAHLTSVQSLEESEFLVKLARLKANSVFSLWIGLHDLDGESLYVWTDGSGYGKFVYWSNGEPNDMYGQEDCIAMVKSSGKWNDNHCSNRKKFVCKSRTEDAPKISILKPASKISDYGYCSEGWIHNGKYCYQFHTDKTDYKAWRDAKRACEQGKNSSTYGELASINTELELAFITMNLKGATTSLWIGMNNFHVRNSFYWTDNSPVNIYNWNEGEPAMISRYHKCVDISPFPRNAGKWSSRSCYLSLGYICKTAAKGAPTHPFSPPPINPSTTDLPSLQCPRVFIKYGESCYKVENNTKTFDESLDACRKLDKRAELISVNSGFEQALLVVLMERTLGSVWTGLNKNPWSSFKFTDYSIPEYLYWERGQPDSQLDERACVKAVVSGTRVGRWDDVNCTQKNFYVCEIYNGEPRITLEEEGLCEPGWLKYRKDCYKHFQVRVRWLHARSTCRKNGGDLLSITNSDEQDFILHNVKRMDTWIGLNDHNIERGFQWSDGSPLTYINWEKNKPSFNRLDLNCVVMKSLNGRWSDKHCYYSSYAFVCKKPLACSSKIKLTSDIITVAAQPISAELDTKELILLDDSPQSLAWCPNTTIDSKPRIQVDFNDVYKITSITTRGRKFGYFNQYVKSFIVEYTSDGYHWYKYKRMGIEETIFANNNGYNLVTIAFDPPIMALAIAVLPAATKYSQICLRLSLRGCASVCQAPLGMKNRKIPDNAITSSSANYPDDNPAQNARPKSNGWCAKNSDLNQWIQVDLGRISLVTKIMTFGDLKNNFVKAYKIQFSADGLKWIDYKQYGVTRIFLGNFQARYPMTHVLSESLQARLVRIIPLSWNKNICMRFELFGCVADCDQPLIQINEYALSDVKLTSSDEKSNPNDARMNSGKAWCPSQQSGQYLEVDFGKMVQLSQMAIRGSPVNFGEARYVETYVLWFWKKINGFNTLWIMLLRSLLVT
ncbi:uncharacterized protein LOC124440117 isoform X2 [Xenia sp. Carnegie-2017]|uniref:uncharacterized protein LOC124440117 isoform X2 n=1 Tax=Xenia sp. Carnegie-2017 TaxID=2897299 RepID=UPI001F04A817|nr:uncharacterized protein LOC124440117 isoform X2 [Xenia sp. Carnegie-2017]